MPRKAAQAVALCPARGEKERQRERAEGEAERLGIRMERGSRAEGTREHCAATVTRARPWGRAARQRVAQRHSDGTRLLASGEQAWQGGRHRLTTRCSHTGGPIRRSAATAWPNSGAGKRPLPAGHGQNAEGMVTTANG
jgi:hypothetical protein